MHSDWQRALASIVTALQKVTESELPPTLDRRFLDLGERKEELRPEERDELMAWVAFTQERSVDKAAAEVTLRRLTTVCPDLAARG